MTREENLHWIDEEIRTWENECQSKHPIKEALYAARKALEQEPTTKIDLRVDCIDRQAAITLVCKNTKEILKDTVSLEVKLSDDYLYENIAKIMSNSKVLPSVTPQESILDKIRTEIRKAWCTHPQNSYEEGLTDQALRDMKIIDRYKAESEGE